MAIMNLICVECKNEIDLSVYSPIDTGDVIECNHCGITLVVKAVSDDNLSVEIADEGK